MIINSDFKDYYDYLLVTGRDTTIVYDRQTKDINREEIDKLILDNVSRLSYSISIKINKKQNRWEYIPTYFSSGMIGFCGQFYPYITTGHSANKQYSYKCFFSLDALKKEFGSNLCNFDNQTFSWGDDRGRYNFVERINRIKSLANDNLFIKFNTPIFIIAPNYNGPIFLNPCLRVYNFEIIKDPYTAFQDIMMYISGVLGKKEKDTIQISDVDMASKKGFDKWSFRKKVR
jgi:hypothetical protein